MARKKKDTKAEEIQKIETVELTESALEVKDEVKEAKPKRTRKTTTKKIEVVEAEVKVKETKPKKKAPVKKAKKDVVEVAEEPVKNIQHNDILIKPNYINSFEKASTNPYELFYKGIKIYDSAINNTEVIFELKYVSVDGKKYPYNRIRLTNK